jgi:hypothetical protein
MPQPMPHNCILATRTAADYDLVRTINKYLLYFVSTLSASTLADKRKPYSTVYHIVVVVPELIDLRIDVARPTLLRPADLLRSVWLYAPPSTEDALQRMIQTMLYLRSALPQPLNEN